MTESNKQSEQTAPSDDVATLYSWANLHGAKYRDFSAARAQTRERARLRAEQAQEEERRQKQFEADAADAQPPAEASLPVKRYYLSGMDAHLAEQQAPPTPEQVPAQKTEQEIVEVETSGQLGAQRSAEEQAKQEQVRAKADIETERTATRKVTEPEGAELSAQSAREQEQAQLREKASQEEKDHEWARELDRVRSQAEGLATAQLSVERAAQQAAEQLARQRVWQQPLNGRFAASQSPAQSALNSSPQSSGPDPLGQGSSSQPQVYRPNASPFPIPPQLVPAREDQAREEISMPRNPWPAPDVKEPAGRPAWLSPDASEASVPSMAATSLPPSLPAPPLLPQAPEDTLQGSRDRMTSRWFALRGVFDGSVPPVEAPPAPSASRAPSLAIFSLAGGVGKTSLVATLGRALSARGERVLLVDTAAFGLLPFFFGATDQRPGVLRTFTPPGMSSDAPIQLVTIDADLLGSEMPGQESLSGEIQNFARGASRILVDLATASGATTRRIMRMAPLVLVPVIPDMNSVVSVSSIDAFFEHNSSPHSRPVLPYYVLNQFDPSLPLHLDVREVLREQLGERLLPFALRRAPSMSEALAEGMTVLDYAPSSSLAEDFATLAGWLKSISAPATTSYRGVRWSER